MPSQNQGRASSARVVTLLSALLLASRASAQDVPLQENSTLTAAEPLQKVVVTATRIETAGENVGSAFTVITREQIENSQASSVSEVLRDVPGLAVVQSGAPGGQTSVFLRGANSNQTLVLIDGARIASPLNGLASFGNLTPDQIERIEIIRGPQSTLYGADAIGGVINIITRRGTGKLKGDVSLEGGSHGTFRQQANVGGAQKGLDYTLGIAHSDTDNAILNNDYENLTVGGQAGYRFNDRARVGVTLRYTNTDKGLPGTIPPGPNPTERLLNENVFGRAALDLTVADWWQQTLSLAETHDNLRDRSGAYGPTDTRTDVVQVGWQHTLPTSDWHTFIAGLDWYQNSGQFSGYGSIFDQTVDNTAGYVQDQVTLWERLVLTGGGRFDSHSQFGDEFTHRFAGVLKLAETATRFKASAGTGFRAPTLNDLFYPGFSNPALVPEKSFGWDAGVEQDLCKGKATVGVRYFQNDIDNLIVVVFVPPFSFTPQNVNRARTQGIEAFLEARPTEALTLRGGYTFLETEDLSTDQPLLRRPKHSGSLGVDYRFCKRFAAHTDATFVGHRLDVGNARNAGYVKWDVALAADVTDHFQVFGRVENLLDDDYEEAKGFPALGITWYVGAKARF